MTAANIIWLIVGLLAMCLIAMGKLGDDPLVEIEIPQSPIPRQYQD